MGISRRRTATRAVEGGEALEVLVMDTNKRVLGEEHPDSSSAWDNLAFTYRKQGRWKEPKR